MDSAGVHSVVDGRRVNSCLTLAVQRRAEITTIEGLQKYRTRKRSAISTPCRPRFSIMMAINADIALQGRSAPQCSVEEQKRGALL